MEIRHLPWTLDGLSAAVASALETGYGGAPNGRVRAVPDRRTIRYYTTLGLIDRPLEMRGRTAYYGRRHLLQLVAIKKLQAAGHGLVDVQRALAGQTDAELARIAGLDVGETSSTSKETPERAEAIESIGPERTADPDLIRRAGDFWRRPPAPRLSEQSDREGDVRSADIGRSARRWQGAELVEGVTLLLALSRPIDSEDIEAIRAAAGPLIETLVRRQLVPSSSPIEGGPP